MSFITDVVSVKINNLAEQTSHIQTVTDNLFYEFLHIEIKYVYRTAVCVNYRIFTPMYIILKHNMQSKSGRCSSLSISTYLQKPVSAGAENNIRV